MNPWPPDRIRTFLVGEGCGDYVPPAREVWDLLDLFIVSLQS